MGIKNPPFPLEAIRPGNFENPTNIKGSVGDGGSIKTTLPTGYVSGKDYFAGKQASGPKTVKTTLPSG